MKTIKILLIAAIIISSISVEAQNKQNSERRSTKGVTTQSKGNQNSQKNKGTSERSITVTTQPSKTYNKVDKSKVTYKKSEPKVVAVRSAGHSQMKEVSYNNRNYYYNSGVFYKKYNNNLVKVSPPSGLRINILPEGYVRVAINNRNYFYFEGTFYLRSNNEYIVETPPVGAIVYALPIDYEKVELNGQIYYEYNGILYERIHYNGERAYQVVGYLDI